MKIPVWGWVLLAGAVFLIVTLVAIETRAPQPAAVASATPAPQGTFTKDATDEEFLAWVHDNVKLQPDVTDEQLVRLSKEVCAAFDAGVDPEFIDASIKSGFSSFQARTNATAVVTAGVAHYCPRHISKL